jgi:metal-responsive CopG/Arc/MetJ family transcriptional regulator
MIRTQIYLPKDLYYHIDQVAKREKRAKAQVIRDTLEKGFKSQQKFQKNAGEALLRLAELGEKLKVKGPKDLSQNIDKYLYGQ